MFGVINGGDYDNVNTHGYSCDNTQGKKNHFSNIIFDNIFVNGSVRGCKSVILYTLYYYVTLDQVLRMITIANYEAR